MVSRYLSKIRSVLTLINIIGLRNWVRFKAHIKQTVEVNSDGITVSNSSILDSGDWLNYRNSVSEIATQDKLFSNFRRSSVFLFAMENVGVENGFEYRKLLGRLTNSEIEIIEDFDQIGNPFKYQFRDIFCSANALRYLRVYRELINIFGSLERKKIVEIGAGYGGQSFFIQKQSNVGSYITFDLPEVNKLVCRFAENANITIKTQTNAELAQTNEIDLVISNYAFSELNRKLQEEYLKNVILKSKSGYIIWNTLSYLGLDGYSLADLIRIIPKSQLLPEVPYTAEGNAILYWN